MLLTLVPDPLWRSIGNPHADSGKASFELTFRTDSPADVLPLGMSQHVFGCRALLVQIAERSLASRSLAWRFSGNG
jgi:hypothetical protein